MTDSQHSSFGNEDIYTSKEARLKEIEKKKKSETKHGLLTRYLLDSNSMISTREIDLKRVSIGEEDEKKPHKTILMVGETGTGKSTLINAMVNYMLGVEFSDRIWCEIIETKEDQSNSQTKEVTVYDVSVDLSSFSLTVIDTPGFGSTEGIEEDFKIAETLYQLFKSKEGVHEIDAVCLVVSGANPRLTTAQRYVFDAILSIFGKDIKRNIVVLITRAPKKPINALKAIKASDVKCARDENGEPVYFRFDSSYCEAFGELHEDEEQYDHEYKASWDVFETNTKNFFKFLHKLNNVDLNLTKCVLRNRKQLIACINNITDKIKNTENKKTELEQTKTALEEYEKEKNDMNNFEYEADEPYKEKVAIEPTEWWHFKSKEATCCTVCEENCHYPGCWWVRDLSWCSVMSNGQCTVCTGRCNYTDHVKEGKIYKEKTRKVKKTYEDLKKKYEKESGEKINIMNCLEKEIDELEKKKSSLIEDSYHCVMTLEDIALKTDTLSTFVHLDFLIEKMKEANNTERVQQLQSKKSKAEAACKALSGYASAYQNTGKPRK